MDISRGNLNMAMVPYRYTLKRIAKQWRSKNIINSMSSGFIIFCSVSSDNFFVVIYTFLSLVLTMDFYYSQLIFFCILFKKDKKTKQVKKDEISWEKMKLLKKGEGVLLLHFEGGHGVPLLNFRGVPDLTFKLWEDRESQVPAFRGPGSRGPCPTFTSCQSKTYYQNIST